MRASFNIRSLVVGGVVAGMVLLLAGAMSTDPLPEIGRYQLSCTQNRCYLVDSMTGQVWPDRVTEFREPKIKSRAEKVDEAAKGYLGRWSGVTPDKEQLSLHLEADGFLHVKDKDGKEHTGRWRLSGDRIILSVDDETIIGQMSGDGRLIMWEEDNEDNRVIFRPVN
jgi:hypothetical protein